MFLIKLDTGRDASTGDGNTTHGALVEFETRFKTKSCCHHQWFGCKISFNSFCGHKLSTTVIRLPIHRNGIGFPKRISVKEMQVFSTYTSLIAITNKLFVDVV